MQVLIILSVLLSLTSGMFLRQFNIEDSSFSPTYIGIISIFFLVFIYLIRFKEIKKNSTFITWWIYINILLVSFTMMKNGPNIESIKFIIFYLFIGLIIGYIQENTISKIYFLTSIVAVFFAIEIIIQYFLVRPSNIVNLRQYTLMDKQFYNDLFVTALPIFLWAIYMRKNRIINIVAVLLIVFTSIYLMQIKSIIFSLVLASMIYLFIVYIKENKFFKKEIKVNTLFKGSILGSILVLISLSVLFLSDLKISQLIPGQMYSVFQLLTGNAAEIPTQYMRYTDTAIIRWNIVQKSYEVFSMHPFLGIGYGNFYMYAIGVFSSLDGLRILKYPSVTESGVLQIIIEGGILGFIAHFSIYVYFLQKVNSNFTNIEKITALIVIARLIGNVSQDSLNFAYWFFIAVLIYLMQRNRKKVNIHENTSV